MIDKEILNAMNRITEQCFERQDCKGCEFEVEDEICFFDKYPLPADWQAFIDEQMKKLEVEETATRLAYLGARKKESRKGYK